MTTSSNAAVSQRRGVHVTLWVLQALLAAFFAFAAVPKLIGDPTTVEMFGLIGLGQWFRYLTGALELLGAIGLLVPRLAGPAALGLACVMVGATITQLFVFDSPVMALPPLVLVLVFVALAWGRRQTIPFLANR
ncbi:DoxX family protein [Saccharopolyspora phatthalungensis]|uniref:Putative membrane protein YphA (DoxX/SURF4 family) n=1 Tax=Saccharopolyspora phatthalungensis TaxID=664693 RepID=A0A840Q8I0_9PSEU|nr:DoxX family protein [Saccharopolyspora phatthalungensis]MBB5156756.1 putative membrane protein YphA (DoxX/SURF4 family) [Saccharopolyspora phatthalungensis]